MALTFPQAHARNSRLLTEVVIFGMLGCAFLALLAGTPHGDPSGIDRALMRDVQGIPWGSFSFIPRLASDIGGGIYGAYLAPAVAAVVFTVTRQWRLLALLAAVFALHYLLISPKLFIEANRPSPVFGVDGGGGLESFPSGHVQWATSFYGLLAFAAWRSTTGRWRWAIVAACALIVLGTMLGRMELGRHWPVDVLAGVIAGLIALRVLVVLHGIGLPRRTLAS
ncbi:MAG: phosphatase PAP2 family protein [Dehalococcoidia bacterium]